MFILREGVCGGEGRGGGVFLSFRIVVIKFPFLPVLLFFFKLAVSSWHHDLHLRHNMEIKTSCFPYQPIFFFFLVCSCLCLDFVIRTASVWKKKKKENNLRIVRKKKKKLTAELRQTENEREKKRYYPKKKKKKKKKVTFPWFVYRSNNTAFITQPSYIYFLFLFISAGCLFIR